MKAKATLLLMCLAIMYSVAVSGENTLDQFVGSWRLVSVEGHSDDGSVTYDWGQNSLG